MVHHRREVRIRAAVRADLDRTIGRNWVVSIINASDRPGTGGYAGSVDAKQSLPFHKNPLWSRRRQGAHVHTPPPGEPPGVPVRTLPLHAAASLHDIGLMRHDQPRIRLAQRIFLETGSVDRPAEGVEGLFYHMVVHDVSGEVSILSGMFGMI